MTVQVKVGTHERLILPNHKIPEILILTFCRRKLVTHKLAEQV